MGVVIDSREVTICFVSFASSIYRTENFTTDSKPLGIVRCGSSYWTTGAKIVTEQSDGSKLSFLLKA